jgi:putative membrane protein
VAFNDVLVGVDRVLNTPLPIAYSIAISQITWVYVMMLPFQMWDDLHWVTIPGSIFAAYIILGIAAIGREIENPFGEDVNDLPLDSFCQELEADIDYIMSNPRPQVAEFFRNPLNKPLNPLSEKSFDSWMGRTKQDIRDALMTKTKADMRVRNSFVVGRDPEDADEKHQGQLQHGQQQQQDS